MECIGIQQTAIKVGATSRTLFPFSGGFVSLSLSTDDTMKQHSALLDLCEGNPPVTGKFSSQRIINTELQTVAIDAKLRIFVVDILNKVLKKQLSQQKFETPWHSGDVPVKIIFLRYIIHTLMFLPYLKATTLWSMFLLELHVRNVKNSNPILALNIGLPCYLIQLTSCNPNYFEFCVRSK